MSLRSLRSRVTRLAKEQRPRPLIEWDNLTCPLEDIRPDRSGIDWRELRTRKPQRVAIDQTEEAIDRELGPIPEGVVPLRSDAESDSAFPPEEAENVLPQPNGVGFPDGYEPEPDSDDEDEPQQETDDAD